MALGMLTLAIIYGTFVLVGHGVISLARRHIQQPLAQSLTIAAIRALFYGPSIGGAHGIVPLPLIFCIWSWRGLEPDVVLYVPAMAVFAFSLLKSYSDYRKASAALAAS